LSKTVVRCAEHDQLFGEPTHRRFSWPARAHRRGQSKTLIGVSKSVHHSKRTV
jgi:hypothetical protein